MAKLSRKLQKVFAENSTDNGQFGSARQGTFVTSNDIDVLQALSAWLSGWNDATLSGDKLPSLEEFQAISYVLSVQLKYMFQEGIPEYLSTENYFINSIVKESGTVNLYKSLTDDNSGNSLSNPTHWSLLVNLDEVSPKSNTTATTDPTVNDDDTEGYSVNSPWINQSTKEAFLCFDATTGAAIWEKTTLSIDELGDVAFLDRMVLGDYRSANPNKVLTAGAIWADSAHVALTYATTVAIDLSTGINFDLTLTGNPTIGNPTNTKVGQRGSIDFIQDGTGSRIPSFASNWKNTADLEFSTDPNARDVLYYDVNASDRIVITGLIKDVG